MAISNFKSTSEITISPQDSTALRREPSISQSLSSTETAPVAGPSNDFSPSKNSLNSVSDQDIIIAVMGPTGSGKSSFINLATGHDHIVIGHNLRSCTQEVQAFRCTHPRDSSRSVVFVDTPGFDDTNIQDTEILQAIADWLAKTYEKGITLTGLLFLHRITDNRMAGTPLRNLTMFERLCGVDALQNVMLITTMWDEIDDDVGSSHEGELQSKYWKSMISVGSRIARFEYTQKSAWTIVDQFTGIRRPLQLQTELVDEKKELAQTAAGSALYQWLENLINQLRELVSKLVHGQARSYGSHTKSMSQEITTAKGQLKRASEQKNKLFVDTQSLRTVSSPEYLTARESFRSDSSWSLPNTTSPIEDNHDPEPRRGGKLAATILALRHAQNIANMTPFPPLKGAVGLSLAVAESVEAMKRTEQALVSLAHTAARLIVGITETVKAGDVPDDTQQIVKDLITELKEIQRLVTRNGSRRGRVRRYILQSPDAHLVAACTERINTACHLFEMKYMMSTRQAIAKIEADMALLTRCPHVLTGQS